MNRPVVLCVDDERIILSSLKAQLQNNLPSGIQIEVAESAEEALEIIQELVSDNIDIPVVIADQIMPGMKGDEFLSHVKHLSPETLTIMLTGQASANAVGKAVNKAGLFRYLSKPWDEVDLVLTIQSAIDSYVHQSKLVKQTGYQTVLNKTLSLALSSLSFGKQISTALQYLLEIPCFNPPALGEVYFIDTCHILNQKSLIDQNDSDFTYTRLSPESISNFDDDNESIQVCFTKLFDNSESDSKKKIILDLEKTTHYLNVTLFKKDRERPAHFICPILYDGDLVGLIFIYVSDDFPMNQEVISFLSAFSHTLSGMYRLSKSNNSLRISNQQLEEHKFKLEELVTQRTEALNLALRSQEDINNQLRAANKELAYFATTDSLTGLLNRRHFFALTEQRSNLLRTQQKSVSVAMIDIDFFKDINDTFGHQVGDEALKKVAHLIKCCFSEEAIVGRLGGEEFAVLMPKTDIQTAFVACQDLLKTIANTEFIALSKHITLTVSIGISDIKQNDTNVEKALLRADKALYKAKESGRNKALKFEEDK
tara:strand:- start:1915 stop:3534 length:1620 start_codon:yes stop_codon:yes gene_type:complete